MGTLKYIGWEVVFWFDRKWFGMRVARLLFNFGCCEDSYYSIVEACGKEKKREFDHMRSKLFLLNFDHDAVKAKIAKYEQLYGKLPE